MHYMGARVNKEAIMINKNLVKQTIMINKETVTHKMKHSFHT